MDSDPKLKRICAAFAEKECANNRDGWCLPEHCPCFAFTPQCGVCQYLLEVVLPLDPVLLAAVNKRIDGKSEMNKKCAVCGAAFIPTSNRQRYCPGCAKEAQRRATAKRARAYRARNLA